ncbi:hypothetical protein [Pseudothermotoga sp.]|uniref:hypothetical protein n=1 Tax=Pseudothermotoga sp. TaxID=2033661 RepID=UPI0031F6316C
MRYKYVAVVILTITIIFVLSGCTDLFGPSPNQLASDLLSKLFTASATEVIYLVTADATLITEANRLHNIVKGSLKPSGYPTPTIAVKGVVDYSTKSYLVQNPPTFIDKVYMIEVLATYGTGSSATSTALMLPMVTIKNVAKKAFFFAVYYEGTTPKFYPGVPF